jgi:hypothetical protein
VVAVGPGSMIAELYHRSTYIIDLPADAMKAFAVGV